MYKVSIIDEGGIQCNCGERAAVGGAVVNCAGLLLNVKVKGQSV